MAGIRELIKDADKSQVAGISFGGQMHGLVILDKDDNVIRPAILWNDGRTTEECDYLNNVIGRISFLSTQPIFPSQVLQHQRSYG